MSIKGCIAEYGSHEQLIAAHGLYARLWRASVRPDTRITQGEVVRIVFIATIFAKKARKRLFLAQPLWLLILTEI